MQINSLVVDDFITWLPRALGDYPELSLEILVGDRVGDMVRDGIDLALVPSVPSHADARVRRVGAFSAVLAATPGLRRRQRLPPPLPQTWRATPACASGKDQAQQHWELVPEGGGSPVLASIGGRVACGDSRALRAALWAGVGIGPRPEASPRG